MNDTLGAFELVKGPHRLKGPLMKGIAAALLLDGVGPIVIMAPDMDKLHKAFEKVANYKLIEEHTIFAIGQYKKRDVVEKKVEKTFGDIFWWYLPKDKLAQLEFDGWEVTGNGAKKLGVAVKENERECKQLLSKVLGLSLKEINQIEINPTPPIPF